MRYGWIAAAVLILPGIVRAEDKAPSYVKDVKPILETNCVRCHKEGTTKGGANLSSVEAILKGGKKGKTLLAPGQPEKSPLLLSMQGKGKAMPPRKEKQRPSKDEIDVIRKWIEAGAKDDSKDTK